MKDINKLRCIDDNDLEHQKLFSKSTNNSNTHRMQLLSTSLKVTKEITPKVYEVVNKILTQLEIKDIELECYVYNNSKMNASCFSIANNKDIIIMLSSSLINNMNPDELSFVIGHEMGHYLLGHLEYHELEREKNELLDMKVSRIYQAHEIGADRIGLICAGSIESSLRAIIKTVSGLNDEFITHNLHSYLHQLQSLKYDALSHTNQTHPIFPIRAKALTLFSMSELYYWWVDDVREAPLSTDTLIMKIRKDLELTTLKNLKNESEHITEKFKLWFYVKAFTEDRNIDKVELFFLEKQFGNKMSTKALNFAKENFNGVNKKYEEYRAKIYLLPHQHKNKMFTEMEYILKNTLLNHKIQKYLKKLVNSVRGEINE